jgi:5-methylcytosine-specific restriction endonuclease McrA
MRDTIQQENLLKKFRRFIVMFRHSTPQQREEFADLIRSMSYKRFLNSEYWQVVRAGAIDTHGSHCHYCGGSGSDVHHKTYEHHGLEHEFLTDLMVVCRDCHGIYHTGGIMPRRRYQANDKGRKA